MSKILGQCKCLDESEKETLIKSLNVSILHSGQLLDKPNISYAKKKYQELIGNFKLLKEIVNSTPACDKGK